MGKATRCTYKVAFRRRREGRTNYSKRIALLKYGNRLVVRKTCRSIIIQLMSYSPKGDKVIIGVSSKDLAEYGFPKLKSVPFAYLLGYLAGKRALAKNVRKAVLDLGRRTPTKSFFAYAALKGAIDAGMEIPHNENVFDDDRFVGKHISDYASKLKASDEAKYRQRFSRYISSKIDPADLVSLIEKAKSKM